MGSVYDMRYRMSRRDRGRLRFKAVSGKGERA